MTNDTMTNLFGLNLLIRRKSNEKKDSIINLIYGVLSQVIVRVLGLLLLRLNIVNYGSEVNGLLSSMTLLVTGIGVTTLQTFYAQILKADHGRWQGNFGCNRSALSLNLTSLWCSRFSTVICISTCCGIEYSDFCCFIYHWVTRYWRCN